MAYDILGNYITDDDSDTPVVNQQQQTRQDIQKSATGAVAPAQTPQAPPAAPQVTATAPVPPTPPKAVQEQVVRAVPGGPVAPPVAPEKGTIAATLPKQPEYNTNNAYNQYTAQNESGNNPNIGYHDLSKGTAYGTYGITSAAYKDVQAMNPMFKDRPITSLTPDEQTAANETYAAVLSQQLQKQGVEPTEQNIRLAHFMGAQGATNYLKTGAVSPAAAAANGGVDQVKAIAQARLAGTDAPASGATNMGAPPTPAAQFIQATQDPKQLTNLRNDESLPTGFRMAAADQDYDNLKQQKDTIQAQQQLKQTMQSGNWMGLAKELSKESESGSIFKAMFYKQAGLNDLAASEQAKIGAGRTWQTVDLGNGQQGVVQVGINGAPIKGYTAEGPMEPEQIATAMTQTYAIGSGGAGARADTSKTLYKDQAGNAWTMTTIPGRTGAVWVNATTGQRSATAPQGIVPISQISMDQKSNGELLTKMMKANADAAAVGAPPIYTPQQINEARTRAGNPNAVPMAVAMDNRQAAAPGQANQGGVTNPAQANQGIGMPGQTTTATPASIAIDNSPAGKIARYEMPMPSASRNSPADIAIRNEVYRLNPTYDGQKYKENATIVNNFANSSAPAAKSVVALKTASNHIHDLLPVIDALQNGQYPTANMVVNAFKKFTGDANVTNMEAIGPAVGAEIMKSFNPAMGSVEERQHIAEAFSAARSPEQLKAAVKMYEGLMVGKLKPLKDDYERTGRKDFWTNVIRDDNVKAMYDAHEAEQNARSGRVQGQTKSGIKFQVVGAPQQ